MNRIYKNLILLVCILCLTFGAYAQQDVIEFTWGISAGTSKTFTVQTRSGEFVEVNWDVDGTDYTTSGIGTLSYNYPGYTEPFAKVSITTTDGPNDITIFRCNNRNVMLLDVSEAPDLEALYCGFNLGLTSLEVNANTALIYLDCANSQLEELDVSNNPALTYLDCSGNGKLDNLILNTALTYLDCYDNNLETLDVSDIPDLEHLNCGFNDLTELLLGDNDNLVYLECSYNQLTTLDVTGTPNLDELGCGNNLLEVLDLTNNTSLTTLNCRSNTDKLNILGYSGFIADSDLRTIWLDDNGFPLYTLYQASEKIGNVNNKFLGTQNLPEEMIAVKGTPERIIRYDRNDFVESQLVYNMELYGVTQFVVRKEHKDEFGEFVLGDLADDEDYTITTVTTTGPHFTIDEKAIVFNNRYINPIDEELYGGYAVEMTNAVIRSQATFPAKVIAHYEVVPGYDITGAISGCGTMEFYYKELFELESPPDTAETAYVRKGDEVLFKFKACDPECYNIRLWVKSKGVIEPDSITDAGIGYYTHLAEYDFLSPTDDYYADTILVTFIPIPYIITATAGTYGTISPSGKHGHVKVNCGNDKTFTFWATDPCYRIHQLYVDGDLVSPDSIVAGIGYYTFEDVREPHTIHVTFEKKPYTITASAGANGTISPIGAVEVLCSNNKTFTFWATDDCFQIYELYVDDDLVLPDSIVAGVGYYTFTNVTTNHTIHITFEEIPYNIVATAGKKGTISPIGNVEALCGNEKTFTFWSTDDCYQISKLYVGGELTAIDSILTELTGEVGYFTFDNVTQDSTIHVTFKKIEYYITATACTVDGTINGEKGTVIDTVYCGTDKVYTFAPADCYRITHVLIDGTNNPAAVTAKSYTFTDIDDDHTIEIVCERITCTVTASAGGDGAISPSGDIPVLCGDDITFTITPNAIPCFEIEQIWVNDVKITPDSIIDGIGYYTIKNVHCPDDFNNTIHATFKKNGDKAFIDVYSGAGGKVYPNGWIFPPVCTDTTFKILPNPGYKINQVYVDGVNIPQAVIDGSYTFYGVIGNHTLVADFVFIGDECTEPLILTASTGTIGGTIFPSGSVTIPCHGSKPYKIIPQEGYRIKEILINGTNVPDSIPGANYTFVDVTVSQTIVVKFEKMDFIITSSVQAPAIGGNISPLGETTVAYGGSKAYTITIQTGYRIKEVLINGINNPAAVSSGKYTFSNVKDNHTIEVIFEPRPFTITASAGANGTIDPTGAVTVLYGADQTFEFEANPGYKIDKVMVNGKNNVAAVAAGSYKFTKVTANQTISVTFVAAPLMTPPMPPLVIDENEAAKMIVYPNPTTGKLNIKNGDLKINTIQVFDVTGRLMQEITNVEGTEIPVDLSSYSEGIYFLNIDGQVIKVLKQQQQ